MGLVRKHQEKVRRAEAERLARETLERKNDLANLTGGAEYELLLTGFGNDRESMRTLPQGAARIERKKALLLTYLPLVEEYIASGERYQNDVLLWCAVWCFDIGDAATGARLMAVAIEQGMTPPDGYKTRESCEIMAADLVYDWAEAEFKAEHNVEPIFGTYLDFVFDDWQVHDIQRMKYAKLKAKLLQRDGDYITALEYAELAERIQPDKAMVITLKRELQKAIADKANAEANAETTGDGEAGAAPSGADIDDDDDDEPPSEAEGDAETPGDGEAEANEDE